MCRMVGCVELSNQDVMRWCLVWDVVLKLNYNEGFWFGLS
jgi:hypothetical protein